MVLNPIEIDKICLLVKQNYQFDLFSYCCASLQRQIQKYMQAFKLDNIEDLSARITSSTVCFEEFISEITVNTTEMFRDSVVWRCIISKIIPIFQDKPSLRIWHAACSSGQEPLSMAILLDQAGLLERSRLIATDLNPIVLQIAQNAIYSFRRIEIYEKNYNTLSLPDSFSNYYNLHQANGKFLDKLTAPITYLQHNLLTSVPEGAFDLIFCRNILIYFNIKCQDQIFTNLYNALVPGGILILGYYEVPYCLTYFPRLIQISENLNIFQKKF